ncbi:hypothetical protein SDC9_151292 [bioreactor metagenome]|uniref:Uncharacterized protein n=1 Tax=bioreactor metagenome TaxID=1076179 RepID=A0A645ERH8_9ZZZZ
MSLKSLVAAVLPDADVDVDVAAVAEELGVAPQPAKLSIITKAIANANTFFILLTSCISNCCF